MALHIMAYHYKLKLPDGILLGYPVLNLSQKLFTPSLLMSLKDFVLRYSTMKMIYDQYVPDTVDPDKDRLISPMHINEREIDSLPPVRIMVAGMDPLCDQSFIFVLKLLKRGKSVRIYEYTNLPHAYWSVEYPGAEETHEKAMEFVKDLLILASMRRQEVVDIGNILGSTMVREYESK